MRSWKHFVGRLCLGLVVVAGVGFGSLKAFAAPDSSTVGAYCDPELCRRACSEIGGPTAGGSCIDEACICHPNERPLPLGP
jgi:hypothetical protein